MRAATILPGYLVPVHKWAKQNLTQGFAYAKDPTSGEEFLFVAQAKTTGIGDVQDSLWHRHKFDGDDLIYMDTMRGHHMGHPQNFHVRISIHGKPWLWASVEQYSKDRQVGVKVARLPYRGGRTATTGDDDFSYINTGSGASTMAITSPEWKIVIRRSKVLTEVYEEHDERNLLKGVNKPLRSFTRLRRPGVYQSSGAGQKSVIVITGATTQSHKVYRHDWPDDTTRQTLSPVWVGDVTNVEATTGPNTSSEPEGVGVIRGVWHIAKRYNSTARRVYQTHRLIW